MLEKLSEQEKTAIAVFDQRAREGDTSNTALFADSFSYPIFRDMPGFGEVIDVGCGIGRAIGMLLDLGIEKYHGVDPSVEQINYCVREFPQHTFEVGEIRELGSKHPERFSGFLMITTLMHIPRTDLDQALSSLRACLVRGAPGMMSLPMGEAPDYLSVVNRYGMLLTLYTPEEVDAALIRNGFRVHQLFSRDGHMLHVHVEAA
jgi:SAM-dependent methyltransferase